MVWLPDGEKIEDMFTRVDRMHATHGHRTTAWARTFKIPSLSSNLCNYSL